MSIEYILAIAIFGVAVAGMAIGAIVAGRRLKGSCGGLAGLRDEQGNPMCEACSNPVADCAEFRRQVASGDRGDDQVEAVERRR